jgi:hypothetical protein
MVGGGGSFGAKAQRRMDQLSSGGGYPMAAYRNGNYMFSVFQNKKY